MTYLQLVNGVLRRLREKEVTSINQKVYSAMVGDFVNDAKHQVEGAWNWSQNRSIVDVATVADQTTYSLTGVGGDPVVHHVWNDTANLMMREMTEMQYKHHTYTSDMTVGTPDRWAWTELDGSGDTQVNVYQTPDAVYNLKFWVSSYQPTLDADSDTLNVPSLPVILLAAAMLAEEKGETGGQTSKRYFEMADKALDDAVAYDASRSGRETEWRVT